ncbi:MAG: hypothetical protein ABIX01_06440 [Chitinophagaceae bacterium]
MKTFIKIILLLTVSQVLLMTAYSQDAMALVKQVKAKLDKVNDYAATGKMKTDVAFLKVPVATVNIYFKKPNKFRISKEKGISIMPKGGVSVNMQNVLTGNSYVALDAGSSTVSGTMVKVVKLLPVSEASDVVLTTLYIDPITLLIRKATTTTKENGTYDVEMTYGKWAESALPDKMIFSFNTKDYKLPKGVTLEFDDGERPNLDKLKDKKGRVEINYQSYIINKGVQDSFFN